MHVSPRATYKPLPHGWMRASARNGRRGCRGVILDVPGGVTRSTKPNATSSQSRTTTVKTGLVKLPFQIVLSVSGKPYDP